MCAQVVAPVSLAACKYGRARMSVKRYVFGLAALALASTLHGCAEGKRPFLIAQICLTNAQDLSIFTREIQSIAQSEHGKFIDNSANTEKELRTLWRTISRPV